MLKRVTTILLICLLALLSYSQEKPKIIHVYVALCDNVNQGIVPVTESLGNGQNPSTNLYWGAYYGIKSYFKRSDSWTRISSTNNIDNQILEQIIFKHNFSNTYLVADAYDGTYIKTCIDHFVQACSGKHRASITIDNQDYQTGGAADLVAYIGHNGLMEFSLDNTYTSNSQEIKPAIVLGCISKEYFHEYLKLARAYPLVWTTGLMAPEAYTLHDALEAWIANKPSNEIANAAAEAYHRYQKCGIIGAKRLLVGGY